MYKVAVLGDKDSIYGFAALGLDVYYADSYEEGLKVFKDVTSSEGYAVVYVTEQLGAMLGAEIERFSYKSFPAIILIPGVKGNTGEGLNSVKRSVEKAVGSDILN